MSDLERKLAPLAECKSRTERTFEAVVYTADMQPDLDGDAAPPEAFEQGQEVVISAWAHNSTGDALPVGKGKIHRDGTHIVVRGAFFDTAAGIEAYQTIKQLRANP